MVPPLCGHVGLVHGKVWGVTSESSSKFLPASLVIVPVGIVHVLGGSGAILVTIHPLVLLGEESTKGLLRWLFILSLLSLGMRPLLKLCALVLFGA